MLCTCEGTIQTPHAANLTPSAYVPAGKLKDGDRAIPVHVQVTDTTNSNPARAAAFWRELVLLLQLSETLGPRCVRALGYVEVPGKSITLVVEARGASVRDALAAGRLGVPDAVRMPRSSRQAATHHLTSSQPDSGCTGYLTFDILSVLLT